MDSLKKPEMILSIVDLIGLVSLAVYGYKKSISFTEELDKLKEHINALLKRTGDITVHGTKLNELHEEIKRINQTIESKGNRLTALSKSVDASNQDIDDIMFMLSQIVKQLKDNGIEVKVNRAVEEENVFSRGNRPSRGRPSGNRSGSGGRTSNRNQQYDDYNESGDRSGSQDEDDVDSQVGEFRNRRRTSFA